MIRAARAEDAACLSALAFRSKAHWGYSDAFMNACRDELCVDAAYLDDHTSFVAEADGRPVGFYSLEPLDGERVELGFLFVEPAHIGQGYGRALIEHAKSAARERGHRALEIVGDPNAVSFYRAAGAVEIGARPSASVPDRTLPLLEIRLD